MTGLKAAIKKAITENSQYTGIKVWGIEKQETMKDNETVWFIEVTVRKKKKIKKYPISYNFLFIKNGNQNKMINWKFDCVKFETALERFRKKKIPDGYTLDYEVKKTEGKKTTFIDINNHHVLAQYL